MGMYYTALAIPYYIGVLWDFVYAHTAWASALLLVFGGWAMREPSVAGQVTDKTPALFVYVSNPFRDTAEGGGHEA